MSFFCMEVVLDQERMSRETRAGGSNEPCCDVGLTPVCVGFAVLRRRVALRSMLASSRWYRRAGDRRVPVPPRSTGARPTYSRAPRAGAASVARGQTGQPLSCRGRFSCAWLCPMMGWAQMPIRLCRALSLLARRAVGSMRCVARRAGDAMQRHYAAAARPRRF